jgi:hypothetical protein
MATATHYPVTPDGRYFVVRARLWRKANPTLPEARASALVKTLMDARRKLLSKDLSQDDRKQARAAIDAAKRAMGERGPVWWTDGAPDYNKRLVKNTPYADWYAGLAGAGVRDAFPLT